MDNTVDAECPFCKYTHIVYYMGSHIDIDCHKCGCWFRFFDDKNSVVTHEPLSYETMRIPCYEVSEHFNISMTDAAWLIRQFRADELEWEFDFFREDTPMAILERFYETMNDRGIYYKTLKED